MVVKIELVILFVRTPAKVGGSVVRLVLVDVVDTIAEDVTALDEGERHKAMLVL